MKSTRGRSSGWWNDPLIADEVQHRVRLLLSRGLGTYEIAGLTGVSSRTVARWRVRMAQEDSAR